jgi:transposase
MNKVKEIAYAALEAVLERCCGLDVHKKTVTACLLIGPLNQPPRELVATFATTTKGLLELRDWLEEHGCTHVAMESTGIYWRPVYHILEGAVTILLVNARHMKNLPGRKTDINDAQWIARLLRWGLLKPSLIPPRPIRDLRDLCRYRKKLSQDVGTEKNRVHKVLEDANIKLASVATDIFGVSGQAMLEALIAGDFSPEQTAEMARGKLRKKIPELIDALEGRMSEHHRFLLSMHLEHLEYLQQAMNKLHTRIDEKIHPYQEQVELVKSLPGIDTVTAQHAFVEMGGDISVFPSDGHFASWIGICPGNHESGGKQKSGQTRKGNRWLSGLLAQGGHAAGRSKGTYAGAFYHRVARRRGKQRAAVATGHHLGRAMYHVLDKGKPYQDLGADYFDRRMHDSLKDHLVRRLQRLGYQCDLTAVAAAA